MTHAGVAGFGDRSKPTSVAGGVLTGHETEVGHELAWTLEAAQITELGGEHHGRLGLEAAEAGDPVDEGLVTGCERERLDAAIEFVSALELVLEKREVLGDLDGIAAIGLAVLAGSRGHERGSGELTREAPVGEGALEHVSCAGRLVAGANGSFGGKALEVPPQLLVVVRESIDSHRLGIAVAQNGDRDRVLVDVEADREHWRGHGLVSCAVRLEAAGGSGTPAQFGC